MNKPEPMTLTTIIILIIIGLAAGMLSGMIGVGGGIIIVPALVYFLAFSQKQAQGTSLGILLLPVGILAVMQYYKQGHVDIKVVVIVSLAFIIGGFFGSKLSLMLPEATLKRIFAIIMILVAIKMLFLDKPANATEEAKTSMEKIWKRDIGANTLQPYLCQKHKKWKQHKNQGLNTGYFSSFGQLSW